MGNVTRPLILGCGALVSVLRAVLAQLSADYAAMLAAKYLDNHSLAEMSPQFGSTVDAVKSKLARRGLRLGMRLD